MNTSRTFSTQPTRYELRFESLRNAEQSCSFPCDASGCVDLDALGDAARVNYLYVRTVVGREFSMPAVTCGG